MKIAIISDTHGNVANFKKAIDFLVKEKIKIILHCGDIGDPESLAESLRGFDGEFFGVFGNMDRDYKILIDEYNKISRIKINYDFLEIELDQKKIVITHFPQEAKKLAESEKFDIVFYGHTHKPWEEKVGNCKMVNPGELAGQIYKPTFAIYDTISSLLELKILERLK